MRKVNLLILLIFSSGPAFTFGETNDDRLRQAIVQFQAGQYDEAASNFEKAARSSESAAAAQVGLARVLIEQGRYKDAEAACQKALAISPADPDAQCVLGHILRLTGRYDEARINYRRVVNQQPTHLEARLHFGKMLWQWGEKQQARQVLQHFISFYQQHLKLTAAELNFVAQACVYLERVRDANNLFLEATKTQPDLWQAYVPWGELMLSKYNVPDAQGIFQDALKANPNCAAAHLGMAKSFRSSSFERAILLAEKALVINPNLVGAHDFLADLKITMGKSDDALEDLDRALAVDPRSVSTRALRAVTFYFLHDDQKFKQEEARILAINPKFGGLYFQIAEVLARRYLFLESVDFYRKAIALDPGHWAAVAGLGTSLSRLGKEDEAKQELERAFAKDPFNKYVGNLLTLFDEFPEYKTHKTKYLTLRIHQKDDAVLSGYARDLADRTLGDLLQKYEIDTDEEIILEIFPSHDDFAVRCFGIPGAQAFLGICFGNVVAMDSPRARSKGDFVWGATLAHELVHVTHLRLTANRIPRWLAEGIAVYETTKAYPYWGMNLDLPFITSFRNDRTLPLNDLDSGFNRPSNPGQVTLSYFQASLIVEFIVQRYGREKLLATFPKFKDGLKTPQVIEAVFGKEIDEFDQEFGNYVKKKYRFDQVDYHFAPHELADSSGDPEAELLEQLEERHNNPFLNFRLGLYYKKEKRYDEAITYLLKAKELFPEFVQKENPYKALFQVYMEIGEKDNAIMTLNELTARNGKNFATLQQLANLCLEDERYDMAIAALRKAIYITPFDSGIHQKLAQTYLSKKQYDGAINELQVTLLTEPQDLAGAHCDLANAYLQAGRKAEAKNAALAALEIAPNYDRAQEILLASIE